MGAPSIFIGIDVAKDHLDIAVRPGGEGWSVSTDEADIAALVSRLVGLQPASHGAGAGGWVPRPDK